MTDAVVVGSGPNGLAAAIRLAQAGVAVTVLEAHDLPGGGTRTTELTEPGLLHDHCSAMHPSGVVSPYLRSLPLGEHGLEWLWPEVDLAHPLDDGSAGVMARDLARTAASLSPDDARRWERTFGPLVRHFGDLVDDTFGPILGPPAHPVLLARFGLAALRPATMLVDRWHDDRARGLFTGVAAHFFGRLDRPLSAAVGLILTAAGHAVGWPVARGGSRAISDALIAVLASYGGSVRCGVEVKDLAQLRDLTGRAPDLVLLDTSPASALRILGDALPDRVRRSYTAYRFGPAAWKVDFAIRGDVPWTSPEARVAGTVHLGGRAEEMVAAERATSSGAMPDRPFVLCGQQYLCDPSRSAGDLNPFYAYAHVPHGYTGDATESLIDQIERFAPGFRDIVVATHVRGPSALESYNANYLGGDIGAGANDGRQLLLRPRLALNPYRTGVDGVFLCSASTPPGAGVHGMCGFHAAEAALASLG
ncbi:phytoene desaturase family protein [Nocardioides insulae]|uniref:phytoene desaturase family protein n=1 Tax=Nocardioides insulae TaxID=394734 RepID=UPI00041FBDE3|nr:NAD(P)/FAD-dependent oxidoreductase [Nocardioides insulae]